MTHGLLQAGPVVLFLAMVGVLLLMVDQAGGRLSGLLVSSLV